jgi:hypothetical protein
MEAVSIPVNKSFRDVFQFRITNPGGDILVPAPIVGLRPVQPGVVTNTSGM